MKNNVVGYYFRGIRSNFMQNSEIAWNTVCLIENDTALKCEEISPSKYFSILEKDINFSNFIDKYDKLNKLSLEIEKINYKDIKFKIGIYSHLRKLNDLEKCVKDDFKCEIILELLFSINELPAELIILSDDQITIENLHNLIDELRKKKRVSNYLDSKEIKFDYAIFPPLTAAILSHEIFGHSMEPDTYGIKLNNMCDLSLNVYDNPELSNSGSMLFDDDGNLLKKTDYIINGKIIENIQLRNVVSLNGTHKLHRVTNTIVELDQSIEKLKTIKNSNIVLIKIINQASVKEDEVTVKASGIYINNLEKYKFMNMTFKWKIDTLVNSIYCSFGRNQSVTTVNNGCTKRGQKYLGVGFSSPGLVFKLIDDYKERNNEISNNKPKRAY